MNPNNPPAFPNVGDNSAGHEIYDGMSLRDYFAAACDVKAYNPVDTFVTKHNRQPTIEELSQHLAFIRYTEADAMLIERAKQQTT